MGEEVENQAKRLIPCIRPDKSVPTLESVDADDPGVKYYDKAADASVRLLTTVLDDSYGVKQKGSFGSGVLISDDGLILTCEHVVNGRDVTVELRTGEKLKAKTVAHLPEHDLALVQLENVSIRQLPYLKMANCKQLKFGIGTAVVGHPKGMAMTFISPGSVISSGRSKDYFGDRPPVVAMSQSEELLKTSCNIESGNSGSPVLNINSEIVGVVFAAEFKPSLNGDQVSSGSYAVPVSTIKKALKAYPDIAKRLRWH